MWCWVNGSEERLAGRDENHSTCCAARLRTAGARSGFSDCRLANEKSPLADEFNGRADSRNRTKFTCFMSTEGCSAGNRRITPAPAAESKARSETHHHHQSLRKRGSPFSVPRASNMFSISTRSPDFSISSTSPYPKSRALRIASSRSASRLRRHAGAESPTNSCCASGTSSSMLREKRAKEEGQAWRNRRRRPAASLRSQGVFHFFLEPRTALFSFHLVSVCVLGGLA